MSVIKDEVVLKVENVYKNFKLPHEKTTSIKSSIVNIFKSKDKTIEVQHALKDISFEVKKGEFFGILGRNGSGKSTLLKILAEIYTPTKGSVARVGKLVPFIELGVGFNPELTGRENVFLNGALFGFSKKEIEAKYDKIVEFAELEKFMDQKLKNYSSGMQVRLAFSVATHAEADILLIDEVLAVGDADFQRKCYSFFKSLKKQGKTVIFVTHDMGAVNEYCDRAMLINDSLKVKEGKANVISNEYLKLFNNAEEAEVKPSADAKDRWGVGGVVFDKITAKVNKENQVDVSVTCHAEKDIEGAVIGFRIKSGTGDLVTGENNQQHGPALDLKAKEKVALSWQIPDIFSSDTYSVDATIRLTDNVTICDNWDNAGSFVIKKKAKTPYIVEPQMKLEVNRS